MGLKQDFESKIEAQLGQWGIDYDNLKKGLNETSEEVREKAREALGGIADKQQSVMEKLNELKKAGDEAWVDFRVGVENASDELKDALEKAISHFRD